MKKSVLSNFLLVVFFYTVGQQLPIGAWNSHFNYTSASLVLPAGDNILCASQNGLFFLHEPTQSVTILDKSKGFGDVGISALMYLEQQQLVIMGYRSGVVDLVWPDHIKTLRALAAIRQPLTKTIFDIVYWGNRLWLATGLGVAVIDLQSGEFRDVYREIGDNGSPIMARKLATRGDTIFVVSDQGLLAGSMTENLFDFTKWKKYPGSDSLGITDMAVYDDTLYLGSETYGLFTYQHASGTWEKSVFMGGAVRSLHA
ncbi:MAG: hypothetical protein OEY56_14315, partial [Cyclobacteriaceae bacterium]|nr:hypothetical protein [Cyclobacteriaceae bacterium]